MVLGTLLWVALPQQEGWTRCPPDSLSTSAMYWFCESSAYQAKLKKANENYESHSKNTFLLLLLFIVKQLQLMTARCLIKETEPCHILDKRSMTEVRNGNYLHGIGEESLFPCLSKLQNYEVIVSDNIQDSLVLSQTLAGTLQEQDKDVCTGIQVFLVCA